MDEANYTFKEICYKTGYTSSAIRYYEKEFNLLIPRDANGRRLFTKAEFDKLLFIKELQDQKYTNGQIKKILQDNNYRVSAMGALQEIALTTETTQLEVINSSSKDLVISLIDKKFNEINDSLLELSQNINGKERDLLISENMKLKMDVKRKSYEILELKENLRFYKGNNKSFFKKIFGK
jgi:DNA-binding transcriptional MerR regulator